MNARLEGKTAAITGSAAGIGLGALFMHAAGRSTGGLAPDSGWATAFLPSLQVQTAFRLTRGLQLLAQIGLGYAIPELQVRSATQVIGTAGQPLLDGALLLQYRPE